MVISLAAPPSITLDAKHALCVRGAFPAQTSASARRQPVERKRRNSWNQVGSFPTSAVRHIVCVPARLFHPADESGAHDPWAGRHVVPFPKHWGTGSWKSGSSRSSWSRLLRMVLLRSSIVPVTLRNVITETTMDVSWDPFGAADGGDAVLAELRDARLTAWRPYTTGDGSPVLQTWLASCKRSGPNVSTRRHRRGESTSASAHL